MGVVLPANPGSLRLCGETFPPRESLSLYGENGARIAISKGENQERRHIQMSATEGEVRQRAQRLKEQVTEKTKEQAGAAYETQRDRIVGEMEKLASALREVAGSLREQNS